MKSKFIPKIFFVKFCRQIFRLHSCIEKIKIAQKIARSRSYDREATIAKLRSRSDRGSFLKLRSGWRSRSQFLMTIGIGIAISILAIGVMPWSFDIFGSKISRLFLPTQELVPWKFNFAPLCFKIASKTILLRSELNFTEKRYPNKGTRKCLMKGTAMKSSDHLKLLINPQKKLKSFVLLYYH